MPWLERGWEEPFNEPKTKQSQNELDYEGRTITVSFESDSVRVEAFQGWKIERTVWAEAEKPAREAIRVFEKLYEIRGQIEREGEKVELVLGEGILSWKRPNGGVFHPILLQRLQLEIRRDYS